MSPPAGAGTRVQVLESELYTRARELQEVNERLRRAHAREREVALHLQRAMLPAPRPLGHHHSAVRYRPATGALNVCGDWYDLVDPTVVSVSIDWERQVLTYSSAVHPPPVLCHPDGTVDFLDRATDPPLGARPEHEPRPQAETAFTDGSVLALYTDGLVERRREDIDTGLDRLADALTRHRAAAPEVLADTLLAELTPPTGVTDDTALLLLRL